MKHVDMQEDSQALKSMNWNAKVVLVELKEWIGVKPERETRDLMTQLLRSLQEEHIRAETREQDCMAQILQSLALKTQLAKQISTNYKQLCSNVSILM